MQSQTYKEVKYGSIIFIVTTIVPQIIAIKFTFLGPPIFSCVSAASSGLTLFAFFACLSQTCLALVLNPAQPLLLSLSLSPLSLRCCHLLCLFPLSTLSPVSAVWFSGIFHHVVPSASSHQFGATLSTSGGLSSLLSLSSSSSASPQTQQHTTAPPAPTRLTSVSSSVPLSPSQAQHSRTQSVLHSPSPPTLLLPPPPPLHSVPSSSSSSSASTHPDVSPSSRSDPLHPLRLPQPSLHHQRIHLSLSLSITTSSTASTSVCTTVAASPSVPSSSLSTLSSSRPFAVHYSPRLPLPPPPSVSGGGGSMWRTQGMHGPHTATQIPGSRLR